MTDQPADSANQDKNVNLSHLPVRVAKQYVKDFSFENPSAPAIYATQNQPKLDMNFEMDVRKLEDNLPPEVKDQILAYEVDVTVNIKAERDNKVMFLLELTYGSLVHVGKNIPGEQIHPLLLIEVPHMAFPFIRQIVSDATTNGGFAPLVLQPVDFRKLYMDRYAQGAPQDQQNGAEASAN